MSSLWIKFSRIFDPSLLPCGLTSALLKFRTEPALAPRLAEFSWLNPTAKRRRSSRSLARFPPQEDASAAGVPYCYYPSPDNGYSVADVRYSPWGVTANLTFRGASLRAHEKSTTPIGTLRLEATFHRDHVLQFKVPRRFSGAGPFRRPRERYRGCCADTPRAAAWEGEAAPTERQSATDRAERRLEEAKQQNCAEGKPLVLVSGLSAC